MKILALPCLLFAALSAMPASADDSQLYLKLTQDHYRFDAKAFKSITCAVDVSALDNTVNTIKTQVDKFSDKLRMDETLSSYSLTLRNDMNVTINDPSFDVVILSEQGMANPAQVKSGIEQMKQGVTHLVQGTDSIIKSMLSDYMDPTTGSDPMQNVKVSKDGGKTIVTYSRSGMDLTDTLDGHQEQSIGKAPGLTMVADSAYAPLDNGKLTFQSGMMHIDQEVQKVDSTITTSYQKLGSVYFPQAISTSIKATTGAGDMHADSVISFNACKIE